VAKLAALERLRTAYALGAVEKWSNRVTAAILSQRYVLGLCATRRCISRYFENLGKFRLPQEMSSEIGGQSAINN
jgi:hypothetical protein